MTQKKIKKTNKGTDFEIDLNKIPNGKRKPIETCKFIRAMRLWRDKSSRSQQVIY